MLIPFYRNNPRLNIEGDCLIRAVSIALDRNYLETIADLHEKIGNNYGIDGISLAISNKYLIELPSIHQNQNPPISLAEFVSYYEDFERPIIFRTRIEYNHYHLSVLRDGKVQDDYKWWEGSRDYKVTDIFVIPRK